MSDPTSDPSLQAASDPRHDPAAEVVELCRDLIRIDTSNYGEEEGPGERKAAELVASLLDEVGIESRLHESEPGRTSLIATWGGTGAARPDQGALLLHGHLDVVPAAAEDWQVDPFSGEIRDGYVWGRGAVDMKDFDAMLLSVVRARARAGRVPDRPVVLCFTADEEAGGHKGAEHLLGVAREELEQCTEAVGEVGGFSTTVRGRRMYLIEAAEKGMAWMKLTARGRAGHGSMINRDNAVTELAAAVARIGAHDWPVRLTPTMKTLLAAVAELAGTEATPENAEALVEEFGGAARMLGAVLRNTTNPTMLGAGYKVNVIPTEASAHVDGRFLPGFEDEFFATLAELCGDRIDIDYVSKQQPWETPYDGDLVDAMSRSILAEDPDAIVAPYLMSGGTDAKHFNKLGMRSYGFAPLRLPSDLDFTALFHGVDERVPVDALEFGARVFDRFLDDI
ncbi:acetylornithine deacetylase/succinyl-diaminopimelate desuccinylase-like protein [Nocardioides ginsengisegetis]|uniref:Acetylornithine deacetylase/succinyl-diaminopimelate desuccinylase-like protein n=1 Tax=Nocardioides ginsengisegetis TaxID=661491 RepID=A0A7W3IZG7_9ACTN|nr:M20/M25/M40 family metallo-hydrolase [Nocardioides ginsengisegetis]MBA8803435.1 acetylornithine deacetylase/succinyl-diaminopimelate desuccinylase-like protein [Nocardioides ginsengisegetis]